MSRILTTCSAAAVLAAIGWAAPASALTMKECGAKYQAAKTAGTLKDMKWADFRKAQCADEDATAAEAKAVDPDADAKPATKPNPATATAPKTGDAKSGSAAAGAGVSATTASGPAVFPKEVSAKYASETPGRARMHTCVDQYRANKETGANGGLTWIQKGGGYYSQCNAKLKG